MIDFRMRKFIARAFLPIFMIYAVLVPRVSYASTPPLTSLMINIGDAVTGDVAVGGVVVGGALALVGVGATVGYLAVQQLACSAGYCTDTGQGIRIPLQVNTAGGAPAPSAPATSTPSGGSYGKQIGWNGVFVGSDGASACAAASGTYNSYLGSCSITAATCVAAGYTSTSCYDGIQVTPNSYQYPVTCASGYTYSSGSCVLSSAREAVPDGYVDYSVTNDNVAQLGENPADLQADAALQVVQTANGTYEVTGKGSNGLPQITTITFDGATQSTVSTQYQTTDANGNSEIVTENTSIDWNSGQVTSQTQSTQSGSISTSGTGTAVGGGTGSVGTATSGSGTNITGGGSGSGGSGTQITNFPSDYARSGEAMNAATSINQTLGGKLDTLNGQFANSSTATDPTVPDSSAMPGFGSTFTNLLAWQLPAHTSTCPAPTVDLSSILGPGSTFTINAHCDLVTNNFQTMRGVMIAIYTVAALFLVLSA